MSRVGIPDVLVKSIARAWLFTDPSILVAKSFVDALLEAQIANKDTHVGAVFTTTPHLSSIVSNLCLTSNFLGLSLVSFD